MQMGVGRRNRREIQQLRNASQFRRNVAQHLERWRATEPLSLWWSKVGLQATHHHRE